MRKSLLLGALCACTFGFICQPIRAQNAPTAPVAPVKSGYDLFVEARALIKDGPNGEPLSTETLAPDENLRLQRLGAARNAPALAKLRAALKAYIVFPAPDFSTPEGAKSRLETNEAVRQFARQFAQEAAVRAADGDAVAAAQSSLDALELSGQSARGPVLDALIGAASASIARKSLLKNAGALNAAQLREVAANWEKISGTFPTYAQTLRDEEQIQMRLIYQNSAADIARLSDPVVMAAATADLKKASDSGQLTAEQIEQGNESLAQMKGLTFADVNADLRAIFDEALKRADQPYFVIKTAAPLRAANPLTAFSAQFLNGTGNRFFSDRDLVNNRELVAALRLRAVKLESGSYPETFDAGADPFSPTLAPLIYKRAGDSYVLYSVGPDGADENGAEIQTAVTDAKTGAKTLTDRLAPNFDGRHCGASFVNL